MIDPMTNLDPLEAVAWTTQHTAATVALGSLQPGQPFVLYFQVGEDPGQLAGAGYGDNWFFRTCELDAHDAAEAPDVQRHFRVGPVDN